jgi:hypothetical protein
LDDEKHREPAVFFIASSSRLYCRIAIENQWDEGLYTSGDLLNDSLYKWIKI